MFADEMNAEQVIETLRGFGLDLFVSEDGVVHGKFREVGKTMTLEMRAVADRLRELNDQCAAILRELSDKCSAPLRELNDQCAAIRRELSDKCSAPLRELSDKCSAILRKEETVALEGLTVEEAIQIGEKVKAGELELLGMVHYHKSTGLVDMTVKGGKKHGG